MTVTLEMPKEIEAQLLADAQARGVPLSEHLRDYILDRYQEDREDLQVAQSRLDDPQPGLSSSQLRKNLGLDR
jgi:predicted DNA-binding protein